MTEFEQKIEFYRQRRARNIAIAVFLFIASIPVIIIFDELFHLSSLGVVMMFLMIAGGVGLIVYTALSVPKDVSQNVNNSNFSNKFDNFNNSNNSKNSQQSHNSVVVASVQKLYWLIVTIIYLGVSFTTMMWHITWIIWLIAGAIEQFFKIIFSITTPYNPGPQEEPTNSNNTTDVTRGNNG